MRRPNNLGKTQHTAFSVVITHRKQTITFISLTLGRVRENVYISICVKPH